MNNVFQDPFYLRYDYKPDCKLHKLPASLRSSTGHSHRYRHTEKTVDVRSLPSAIPQLTSSGVSPLFYSHRTYLSLLWVVICYLYLTWWCTTWLDGYIVWKCVYWCYMSDNEARFSHYHSQEVDSSWLECSPGTNEVLFGLSVENSYPTMQCRAADDGFDNVYWLRMFKTKYRIFNWT